LFLPAVPWWPAEAREDCSWRKLVRQHEGRSIPATDCTADNTQQEDLQRAEETWGTGEELLSWQHECCLPL